MAAPGIGITLGSCADTTDYQRLNCSGAVDLLDFRVDSSKYPPGTTGVLDLHFSANNATACIALFDAAGPQLLPGSELCATSAGNVRLFSTPFSLNSGSRDYRLLAKARQTSGAACSTTCGTLQGARLILSWP